MHTKMDAEFYTNWIARFRGKHSIGMQGYRKVESVKYLSEAERDKDIEIYLKEHPDMFLDEKIKQRYVKFKRNNEFFDLIMGEDICTQ